MECERDHRNKADGEKWPSGNAMSIPMLAIITVGAHLLVALEHARELRVYIYVAAQAQSNTTSVNHVP